MENNTQTNEVVQSTQTTDTAVDYKALYEAQQAEYTNLKNSFDRTSSEVASLKKAQRERLSADEKAKADAEERENYYKAIERENQLIKTKSQLSKTIGDDEKLLDKVANSFIDGDLIGGITEINNYVAKMVDTYKKKITQAELVNNQTPPATTADNGLTKESYRKMSLSEKAKLAQTDPETYKRLNS